MRAAQNKPWFVSTVLFTKGQKKLGELGSSLVLPTSPSGDVVPKKYLLASAASILFEIQHCSGWEGGGRLASFTIIIR